MFTVSVGNLPPQAIVVIKITYVTELQVEGELINFRLPGSVAPWKQKYVDAPEFKDKVGTFFDMVVDVTSCITWNVIILYNTVQYLLLIVIILI